jgi:hypothetical protein
MAVVAAAVVALVVVLVGGNSSSYYVGQAADNYTHTNSTFVILKQQIAALVTCTYLNNMTA